MDFEIMQIFLNLPLFKNVKRKIKTNPMKTILLSISVLILSANIYAQNYHKMVDPGNKWNYLYSLYFVKCGKSTQQMNADKSQKSIQCGGGETRTYSYTLSNDTLISGVHYSKVLCDIIKYNGDTLVYTGAMREDTVEQKIFVRLPDQDEQLLYSFNDNVGDTISIDTTIFKDVYTIRYIKKIESYTFNEFTGKKITISDTSRRVDPEDTKAPWESYTDIWYEGIGSFKKLIETPGISSLDLELLCFWNNDNKIYASDKGYCVDATLTGVEEQPVESIVKVYPVPTDNLLNIDTKLPVNKVELKDLTGKLLISTSSLQMDISKVNSGVYFLVIYFNSGEMVTKKIIKSVL